LATTDGTNWSSFPSGTTNNLYAVCVGNGRFVAVGDRGTILVSDNGQQWKDQSQFMQSTLTDLDYGGGRFWARALSVLIHSEDGISWISNRIVGASSPTDLIVNNSEVWIVDFGSVLQLLEGNRLSTHWARIGAGRAVRAVMYDQVIAAITSFNSIAYSLNGVDWTEREGVQPWRLAQIRALRGSVYAVGMQGVIIRSAPRAKLSFQRDSTSVLRLGPVDGRQFRVEYSDDPHRPNGWKLLRPATPDAEGPRWIDDEELRPSPRFYRAVLE
jgi:hypothetical protein